VGENQWRDHTIFQHALSRYVYNRSLFVIFDSYDSFLVEMAEE